MNVTDSFMVSHLVKELVTMRVRSQEDPCVVAAALVGEAAGVALKSRPEEADRVVSDACYGAMQALLVEKQDLGRAASLMLAEVMELAAGLRLDPSVARASALDGFARLRALLSQEQIIDLLDTLESQLPGSGSAFGRALATRHYPS